MEPCDKTKQTCTEPKAPSDFFQWTPTEPFAEGVSAETLILDRWFYISPYIQSYIKFLLKGTHKFRETEYGKRRIDLLDFFRHAFRPHIYTYRDGDEKRNPWVPEYDVYDQQMSQMGAYLNSVDFSDGQSRLNGYNPESFTEIPTGEDFGPMPIQNPSIKYGYFQDGYTNLFLKYNLGNGTYTRGIINRLNEHQHTGDNYILPTALMGGNYGMLNTYMTDMSNIYDIKMLQDNAKSRLKMNPKALEWVGDPRSGTGYHRWFGRANNYDPWTSKWWFGRTNYDWPDYQMIGDPYSQVMHRGKGGPGYGSEWIYDRSIPNPAGQDYLKIPRQMFTLGTPDLGPVPFWKAVYEDWKIVEPYNNLGENTRVDDEYLENVRKRKADPSKSEFKIKLLLIQKILRCYIELGRFP